MTRDSDLAKAFTNPVALVLIGLVMGGGGMFVASPTSGQPIEIRLPDEYNELVIGQGVATQVLASIEKQLGEIKVEMSKGREATDRLAMSLQQTTTRTEVLGSGLEQVRREMEGLHTRLDRIDRTFPGAKP